MKTLLMSTVTPWMADGWKEKIETCLFVFSFRRCACACYCKERKLDEWIEYQERKTTERKTGGGGAKCHDMSRVRVRVSLRG